MTSPVPSSPERRSFLKKGLLGAALLFVGGAIPIALRGGLDRARPRGALRLFTAARVRDLRGDRGAHRPR